MKEGRFARGWRLTRKSGTVVRMRPGLLVIPGRSGRRLAGRSGRVLGPWCVRPDITTRTSPLRSTPRSAPTRSPSSTYFNVAFYALAAATIDGRPMTTAGLGHARSRILPSPCGRSSRPRRRRAARARAASRRRTGGRVSSGSPSVGLVARDLSSSAACPARCWRSRMSASAGAAALGQRSVALERSLSGAAVCVAGGLCPSRASASARSESAWPGRFGAARADRRCGRRAHDARWYRRRWAQVFRLAVFRHASGEAGPGRCGRRSRRRVHAAPRPTLGLL